MRIRPPRRRPRWQSPLRRWRRSRTLTSRCKTIADSGRQRMARHQIVGMRPARQRLDAIKPRGDVLMLRGKIKAVFLRRVVEVTGERYVGDGRLRAQKIGAA